MNKLEYLVNKLQPTKFYNTIQRRVYVLRGAATVSHNSATAIAQVVDKLLNTLETENQLVVTDINSVIFSVTPDLNTLFPTEIARQRPGWEQVPLLDVQHMEVVDGLERCIRVLIHLNTCNPHNLRPVYLGHAAQLRPDLA